MCRPESEAQEQAALQPKLAWDDSDTVARVSSGVEFRPHRRYWLIGGKYYDLEPFLHRHPGGKQLLLLARDRFDDCTFVFEAHHSDYKKTRAVLRKYEVKPSNGMDAAAPVLVAGKHHVKLLDDDAFFSVLRQRVNEHLKRNGGAGPTRECVVLFWATLALWAALWVQAVVSGSLFAAVAVGLVGAVLGGFGHNWVHQPTYRTWALLSLDTVGFSSEAWLREHLLQHHMYTNTPKDNHFKGTDPWFVTDPTVKRNMLQTYITPYLNPLLLSVGAFANYLAHTAAMFCGQEQLSVGKLILPAQIGLMIHCWGPLQGLFLCWVIFGTTSVWYFTLALMNHNAEHCTDVKNRNASADWGVAQLNSSADFGTGRSFVASLPYLWLNYHTVHHMFPHTDMSKHPGIQSILEKTAKEFGILYRTGDVWTLYKEMLQSFSTPASLFQEINVYAGAI